MTIYDDSRVRAGEGTPEVPAPPTAEPVLSAPTVPSTVPAAPDRRQEGQQAAPPSPPAPGHRTWLHSNRAALILLAGDLVALAVAVVASASLTLPDVLFAALMIWLVGSAGLYRSRFSLSILDDAPRLIGRTVVAGALVALLAQATGMSFPLAEWPMAALTVAAIVLMRALTYHLVRLLRRRPAFSHPTLIVGAGVVGQDLALAMRDHSAYGLTPVGFVDDTPLVTGLASAAPILGGTADLADLIEELAVEEVVIAFTATSGETMVEVIRTADRLECEISVVPRLFELASRGSETDEINGIPINRLHRAPFRSLTWPLKRVLDFSVSGLALVLLSPLLGLIALVLRLTDGPGVIFRQERVGIDGHSFELLKFRSLRPVDDDESSTKWNIKHDDRLGPVGRFIRKTSIDELPQLWNIVRGDMSLVGPRPERPYFVDAFRDAFPRYEARHRVPCGLTGWAQIHGLRGDTSIEDRARFDNYYIENWSLWLDITIILRTVGSLMKGSG